MTSTRSELFCKANWRTQGQNVRINNQIKYRWNCHHGLIGALYLNGKFFLNSDGGRRRRRSSRTTSLSVSPSLWHDAQVSNWASKFCPWLANSFLMDWKKRCLELKLNCLKFFEPAEQTKLSIWLIEKSLWTRGI